MSNSRKHEPVMVTVDNMAILTLRGWVSGNAGNATDPQGMSGSVIKGTELGAVVTYPSSSVPGYGALQLPTGSVLVTLPPRSRYNQVYAWEVAFEPYSGSNVGVSNFDTAMRAGKSPLKLTPIKLFHNVSSGSFAFCFARSSGTSVNGADDLYIGTVPTDTLNSTQPAIEWQLVAYLRNTDRKV